MSSGNFGGLAGSIAAAALVPIMLRAFRANAMKVGQQPVLEYGRGIKALTTIFWIFWVGLVGLAVFMPKREPDDAMIAFSMVAAFFALVLYCHLEFFFVKVGYDESGIHTLSPWRRHRSIPWSDIQRVTFSSVAMWYVIHTATQGRVRLHLFLGGIDSLLDELRRRGVSVADRPAM